MGAARKNGKNRDDGYALIAAIVAMLAFSLLALEVLADSRGDVAMASAEMQRARLTNAADAGLAMALAGISTDEQDARWAIDGRRRDTSFNGVSLAITIEDERGKIPLNLIDEDQVRNMFEMAGVSGERLEILADSFADWTDDDSDPRPHGAEKADYASLGIQPRNGPFRTLDELRQLKGMDDALFARLAPALTVFFGESGGFSPSTSQPLALAVMTEGGVNSPAYLERQRELAGERPALEIEDEQPLEGRTLTVRILASDNADGQFRRSAIVELTGNPKEPYWVRWMSL